MGAQTIFGLESLFSNVRNKWARTVGIAAFLHLPSNSVHRFFIRTGDSLHPIMPCGLLKTANLAQICQEQNYI